MPRVYLSPPDVGEAERRHLLAALESGWVAPLGPDVNAFEAELAAVGGVAHCAALSSGTAALHLGLLLLGVVPGDEVLVPSFTFAATANAVTYTGARPVFVDADPATWQIDPALVASELSARARRRALPAAVISVDLYGQCADADALASACREYDVPLLEDAAEALGATYRGRPAGSLGDLATFSFNGNKIITTSGGGALLGDDEALIARSLFLATQARDPAPHYEHSTIGFNYRMSNLLAALGRAQLASLGERVARRRAHFGAYTAAVADLPGVAMMPVAEYGEPNAWLSCLTLDPALCPATPEEVRLALEVEDIEARPLWKPMHLQPVFADAEVVGGSVCASLFERGLCLPSGSSLTKTDRDRVIAILRDCCGAG